MATRLKDGQKPFIAGDGIQIDENNVISVLLRATNNLIHVNEDGELYTDLQLEDGILPTDDFPVGVTTGKILQEDGWPQNGIILNWKTTSGDYNRLIYANDGKLYLDPGTGIWNEIGGSGGGGTECNTKTFFISGPTDITTAQAILDWQRSGKNALVGYGGEIYLFEGYNVGTGTPAEWQAFNSTIRHWVGQGYSETVANIIKINYDTTTGVVSSVAFDEAKITNASIDPTTQYNQAFMPTLPYQPASKAYVDLNSSNVKVFHINKDGSTTDTDTLTEAVQWHEEGKYPVIEMNDEYFWLNAAEESGRDTNQGYLYMRNPTIQRQETSNGTRLRQQTMYVPFYTDTHISTGAIQLYINNLTNSFLEEGVNYGSPYSPQYDGSPATKKYVDDSIPEAGYGLESVEQQNWDTQGPCPEGFHIPTLSELNYLKLVLSNMVTATGDNISEYLKMPYMGQISWQDGVQDTSELFFGFWGSLSYPNDDNNSAYTLYSETGYMDVIDSPKATGLPIRPFYNTFVQPDSSWTTLYDGSGSFGTNAGIFWNQTEGLISIRLGDNYSTVYRITIADKNLGATTVWNYGDTLTAANCGNYYQWGNNYGFSYGSQTGVSGQVDASGYGPGNYYSSSDFLINNQDWSSVTNNNLWGGETNVQEIVKVYNNILPFEPQNTGATGQVLTKTADGYSWQNGGGGGGGGSYSGGKNIDITNDVINLKLIEVNISTPRGTIAKVGTTTAGNYTPNTGDLLLVNFVNGTTATRMTLDIDGSGAIDVRVKPESTEITTTLYMTGNNQKVIMYFDGTYYRTWSLHNNYAVMTDLEMQAGSSLSPRNISPALLKSAVQYWGPKTATSTTEGVIKLGSDTVQTEAAETPSSASRRTYPVQLNSSGQAVVNVPWTDSGGGGGGGSYTPGDGIDITNSVISNTMYPSNQSTGNVGDILAKTANGTAWLDSGTLTNVKAWNVTSATSSTLESIVNWVNTGATYSAILKLDAQPDVFVYGKSVTVGSTTTYYFPSVENSKNADTTTGPSTGYTTVYNAAYTITYDGNTYTGAYVPQWQSVANVIEPTGVPYTGYFTPTADYHPATKKYVDDAISQAGGGNVSSSTINNIWTGTQVEYDAITTKSTTTLYFVIES